MNGKLKNALNAIEASDTLKSHTKTYVLDQLEQRKSPTPKRMYRLVPSVVLLFALIIGFRLIYFTPVTTLSIDINPSIELDVNRFDHVVDVHAYNVDGTQLLTSMDSVKYKPYSKALETLLESEDISVLLEKNEILSIGVIGTNENTMNAMISEVENCIAHKNNVYCYSSHTSEVEHAHTYGFSYGKYKIYSDLLEAGVDLSIEEAQSMTMKELLRLMPDYESQAFEQETQNGHGHQHRHHQ